jgi:hypothetical protein
MGPHGTTIALLSGMNQDELLEAHMTRMLADYGVDPFRLIDHAQEHVADDADAIALLEHAYTAVFESATEETR